MTVVTGEHIRKLRHYKGLMQKEAAQKLEMTQQAYSRIERRTAVRNITLWKILAAFECSSEDFEKVNNSPPPNSQVN